MKFIPVLELEPGHYSQQERASPDADDRSGWAAYWRNCLADSGITAKPIKEGSWFVALKDLDEHSLGQIVQRELEEHYEPGEEMSALSGGFFLQCEGIPDGISPSCCGDLSNIDDWIDAVNYVGNEAQELWIGHPWLMVRGDEERLEISLTVEYGKLPEPYVFAVDRKMLKHQIRLAVDELEAFKARIIPHVQDVIGGFESSRVGHLLVYGPHNVVA